MLRAATGSPLRGRRYVSLRGRAGFARVYRVGRRRKVGGVLVVALREGQGPARVGVVVGRRVGGAVVRNRVKRRLREALARVELGEATAYIVVALPGAASVSFGEIQSWVRRGTRPNRAEAKENE